jgi:hypothetical protein
MQRKKDKHAVKCEEGVGLWDGLALVAVRVPGFEKLDVKFDYGKREKGGKGR